MRLQTMKLSTTMKLTTRGKKELLSDLNTVKKVISSDINFLMKPTTDEFNPDIILSDIRLLEFVLDCLKNGGYSND